MADLGDATINGKSGKIYTFKMFPIGTNFKSIGGVYIFVKHFLGTDKSNNYNLIYCGKTEDLSTRFDDHHKADCIKKNGANRICVMSVSTEKERTSIEEDILAAYNFTCNKMLN